MQKDTRVRWLGQKGATICGHQNVRKSESPKVRTTYESRGAIFNLWDIWTHRSHHPNVEPGFGLRGTRLKDNSTMTSAYGSLDVMRRYNDVDWRRITKRTGKTTIFGYGPRTAAAAKTVRTAYSGLRRR